MFQKDRVFRDPIHGLIHISPKDSFLTELIDTVEFQRLHRVRQLGVGSLTFPGADHSRFCHSLGVLHVATRILEGLKDRYHGSKVEALVEKHHQTIKAAALLHDIGHGPFSHLVERAFKNQKDHEHRTVEMITAPESGVRQALEKSGQDIQAVRSVIDHRFPCLFLQDIVSSQLDADRMDYLIRDSHFCGVDYGVFDLEWILNSLCVGSYAEDNDNAKYWRLCLDEKRGLQVAEQLILARQHMSLQVYYHKSTRRWEAVFLCLIREAARLADQEELPPETPALAVKFLRKRGKISHEEFLQLDEPLLLTAFSLWRNAKSPAHEWLSALAKGFLERRKVLTRVDLPEDLPADLESLLRLRLEEELADVGESHWELDPGEFKPYKGDDPAVRDKDREGYEDGVLANAILVSDGETKKRATPVAEISSIFKLLTRQQFRLRRLYCDAKLKSRVDKIVSDILESAQLEPPLE